MKTLYISDLDGTLLNNEAQLSKKSLDILNFLIENGVNFSLATARTYATVVPLMKKLNLNVPAVLMNGVCIYDCKKFKALKFHKLNFETSAEIVAVFKKHNKCPMLYYDDNGKMTVEYINLTTEAQKSYVSTRTELYNKRMYQVEQYSLSENRPIVYIAILDSKEALEPIYEEICKREDVESNFYIDTYSKDYFLEIYSKDASKAKSAFEIKKMLGADRIVAFGDNLNDIPLFKISDEAYAVKNAHEQLKKYATGIIDTNYNDAVAKFILNRFNNKQI